MSMVLDWVRAREPAPPPELLLWLEAGGDDGLGSSVLARRGVQALHDAMQEDPSNRESAFRLLAADAYLTYACEAAVDDRDVAAILVGILDRVGEMTR